MSPTYKLAVIVSMIDKMTGPAKKAFGQLKQYEQLVEKGKGWVEYGKQTSITGAVVQESADKMIRALQSILGPTEAIQDRLADLETVTTSTMGSMQKSIEATRKAALDWSKIHADNAMTFLEASTIIAGAGLNDIEAIEGTRAALTMAKATFGEAGEAAELMGVLYNNMADKTKNLRYEMERMADVVTVTQQLYQIKNMTQLAEGYKYATPAALQYKVSLEEVSAVLGMLNTTGLAGSQAGTAYAATMRQLIKASNELGFAIGRNADGGVSLIKTIENIRQKYGEFGEMSDHIKLKFQQAFRDQGIRTIALLMGKTAELNENLKAITNSSGAAAAAQETIEKKSPAKQYQILRQNIDAVKDSIAVNLIPTILGCIPPINALLDRFGRFAAAHPILTKLAVAGFALIAVLMAIVAPIITLTGSMIMMAGYGLQGIGQLTKGFLYLRTLITSEKFINSFKLIGSSARTAFMGCSQAILSAARATWSFTAALLANPITWVVLAVAALAVGAYLLIKNWDKVKGVFINLWAGIVDVWNKILPYVKAFGLALLVAFMPFIGLPLLVIKNWDRIGPMLGQVFGAIGNFFANLGKMAFEWGGNLLNNFINGIKEKVAALKKGVIYVAEQIKQYLGFQSPAKAGPGATAHKWAPNLMKMYQAGIVAGTPGVRRAALGTALAISMALNSAAPAFGSRVQSQTVPTLQPAIIQTGSNSDNQNIRSDMSRPIIFQNCTFTISANNPDDFFRQLKQISEEVG